MRPRRNLFFGSFLVIALSSSTQAGTTWDGGGANTNINTQENWNDNLNPTLTGGSSTLTFGTGGSTAVINTNVDLAGIVINRDANFEIANGSGSLTIGSGGISVTLPTTTGRSHTISESNLILGATQNWSVTNNTGVAELTVSSTIDDGVNTYGITKQGTGRLILSGNNSFGGNVTVNAGTLRITHNNALGTTSKELVMQGVSRIVELSGGITLGNHIAFRLATNSGDGAGLSSISGNNIIQGKINQDFGNPAMNISSSAGSTLTLNGDVELVNSTRGMLFGGASVNDNTVNGRIMQNAVGNVSSVTKQGVGTWVFNGNNSYGGDTSVTGGTLKLGHSNALGFGAVRKASDGTTGAGTTTVSSGATLDLNGTSAINEAIILNGTGVGANGALINNSGTAATIGGTGGLAGINVSATGIGSGLSTAPTVAISGTGTGAAATALLGLTTASITSVTNGGTSGWAVGDTLNVSGGGGSGAVATVTGINGSGQITGLAITNAGFGYSGSSFTLARATGSGAGTPTISANATNFTVGALQVTAAGTGYTGTPTVTVGGSTAAVTPFYSSVTLASNSSVGGSGNMTIDAVVSESGGARTLTKVGGGTLTLSSNNTYTGPTNVDQGKLVVNGNISTSVLTTVGNTATLGGTGTTGAVTIADGGTLAPGNSAGTLAISGALTLNSLSKLVFELNPSNNTIGLGVNDLITGVNGLTLDGLLSVAATSGSFAGVTSGSWRLINYTGSLTNNSLSFDSMPALATGYSWALDTSTAGQINLTVIPEPRAALLGGIGMLLLLRRRRA